MTYRASRMREANPLLAAREARPACCIRCGADNPPYMVPLPLGGSLDSRSETRLCERCWGRFVVYCAMYFGIDLPLPDPWTPPRKPVREDAPDWVPGFGPVPGSDMTQGNAGGHAP